MQLAVDSVSAPLNRITPPRNIDDSGHSWGDDESYLRISESSSVSSNDEDGEVRQATRQRLSEGEQNEFLEPKNLPELKLPKPQLPTVTLLQKSREGGRGSCSNSCKISGEPMHKIQECLAAPALYTGEFAGEIPKGALYVGTNERIEGGYKHTDQFFLVPAVDRNSNQLCEQQREVNSHTQPDESQNVCNLSPNSHQRQKKCQGNVDRQSADANNNASKPTAPTPNTTLNGGMTTKVYKDKPAIKKKPVIQKQRTSLSTQNTACTTVLNKDKEMVSETLAQHTSTQSPHPQPERTLSVDTDGGFDNPFVSNGSQATSRSCSVASSASLSSPSHQYKEIQRGGDIPLSGLRKPAPITPPPKAVSPPPNVPNLVRSQANIPTNRNHATEATTSSSEQTRGRETFCSEYREVSLERSGSRGRQIHAFRSKRREPTPSPQRSHNLYIVQQSDRSTDQTPTSLNLDINSSAVYIRRRARDNVTLSMCSPKEKTTLTKGYTRHRPPSPVPSWSSAGSNVKRNSSRPSLIIVPPAEKLSKERSSVREGCVIKKARTISAVEELNIRIPCAVKSVVAEKPKKIPEAVAGYDRSPAPLPRVQRDQSDAKRRELLSKIEQDERRKKAKEEEQERKARRHSDYFTLKEKSPIPHDRYDGPFFMSMSAPQSPARSTTSQNSPRALTSEPKKPRSAIALYHFNAQHSRELSVHKGERVFITRRVNGNWYEVSKNGRRGIVPVTYLEIIHERGISPPTPLRPAPPTLREGSAVAKYNFNPQTGAELALRRGDQVSLIKRVDPNWYEGRLQGSITAGIFPVSYVQVISEPVQEDIGHGSTPPVNRSQSAPDRTTGGAMVSPTQYYKPPEYSPLSGYASIDEVTADDASNNNNNNNHYVDKNSSTDVHKNNCFIAKSGQSHRGLEMPSYKSLYNYEPHNEDELQLKQGDIVHVIEKCADGWFVGTSGRTGLFGTFPGNYVTPV